MIDFSQYPPMSVIAVKCDDSDQGFVVRQKCSSHSPFILVREGGWVARIDKHGKILSSFDGQEYPVDHYRPTRIISVLNPQPNSSPPSKDLTNDEHRFVVLSSNSIPKFGHTLDSAICLAEKMVETGRSSLVYVTKIVKVVQSKPVAVTSDWEPEVGE